MKRQWRIHRQLRTATDGAQRWDQAYQLLLECTRIQARRHVPVQAQKNHLVSPNSRVSVGHWCDVSGWLFSPVVLLSHRGGRER